MPHDSDNPLSRSLIGKIAVGRGFLTEQELEEHRRSEQAAGGPLPLLEYLLEKKGLTPEQVVDLLRAKAQGPAAGGRGAENAENGTPTVSGASDDDVLSIEPAGPSPTASTFSAPPAPSAIPAPSVSADDDPLSIEPAGPAETGSASAKAVTRRRPRPAPSTPVVSAPSPSYKMRFGYLAVRLGYLTPDQLGVALDTQKFLLKKGKPARLGEVLVSQGILDGKHVLTLLKLQGKTLLRCGGCGTRFNAERFDAAHPLPCRKCGKPLAAAAPGDVADAPSAQGTFVNLKSVRGLDPSTFHAPESSLPVLPESAVPAVPLGRPVSSSRLLPAIPVARSAPAPAAPPAPVSAAPAKSPAARPPAPKQYEYRDYAPAQTSDEMPRWFWPACGAGLLTAVLGGWFFSILGGSNDGDRAPAPAPRPPPVATRPPVVARKESGLSPEAPAKGESPLPGTSDPRTEPVTPPLRPIEVPPTALPSVSAPPAAPVEENPPGTDVTVLTDAASSSGTPDAPIPADPARTLARLRSVHRDPPREEFQIVADVVRSGGATVVRLAGAVPEGAPDGTAVLLLFYPGRQREGVGQLLQRRVAIRRGVFADDLPGEIAESLTGSCRVTARLDDLQPAEIGTRIPPAARAWRGELRFVAGSPDRLGSDALRWTADLLPVAAALRRGWPGLGDLHRRTGAGEDTAAAWTEWKSRNPLGTARAALAGLDERPESDRIMPTAAARAEDLAAALDAMYVAVARAAGETVPPSFRTTAVPAVPPEDILRELPNDFGRAIGEDAVRSFHAALRQLAESALLESPAPGLADLRKEAGTLDARFQELVQMEGWSAVAPPGAADLAVAFPALRALLDAAGRSRKEAEPVLDDLRRKLTEAN